MNLPNIELEAAFAKRLGVAANGLSRMVDEGTLPKPFARRDTKPVWNEKNVREYFGAIQNDQSAYAPIDPALGDAELKQFAAYVCPASSSGHIGNRRPSYLVLYSGASPRNAAGNFEVGVYPVLWVQTQQGVIGESIALPDGVASNSITPVPWAQVRQGCGYPLTLFKLDVTARQTLQVGSGIRRGGTISTGTLKASLAVPGAVTRFQGGKVRF